MATKYDNLKEIFKKHKNLSKKIFNKKLLEKIKTILDLYDYHYEESFYMEKSNFPKYLKQHITKIQDECPQQKSPKIKQE